ncbi:hypothetical protein JQ597_01145 [Bradyrhizobium sp. AUGA SZCCT0177]|uniref:hypothetical protein n=1 Tax=Bradyrhizobium sp. AUGA SZCCT0177 TaxID=2807665 RepID=UPI001BA64B4A|nr:hypothetical protein [Bradyrhizobium sp. AUGA SZCCT0177]MBR1280638.1 hypothetical protein [Bradyrhizobium sp. AUGA SZCCT0177]
MQSKDGPGAQHAGGVWKQEKFSWSAAPTPPAPPSAQKQQAPNGSNANAAKPPAAAKPAPAVRLTPPEDKPAEGQPK